MRTEFYALKWRRFAPFEIAPRVRIKKQKYNEIVNKWRNEETNRTLRATGEVRIRFPNLAYDYCVIHYYPDQFYDALQQSGLV